MKFWLGLCCCLVLMSSVVAEVKPAKGFVPDEATAVKIAEAVLIPISGERRVVSERPYTATLDNDTWTVSGTLYCLDKNGKKKTQGCRGGVAVVKISKADGRILAVEYGR